MSGFTAVRPAPGTLSRADSSLSPRSLLSPLHELSYAAREPGPRSRKGRKTNETVWPRTVNLFLCSCGWATGAGDLGNLGRRKGLSPFLAVALRRDCPLSGCCWLPPGRHGECTVPRSKGSGRSPGDGVQKASADPHVTDGEGRAPSARAVLGFKPSLSLTMSGLSGCPEGHLGS